MSVTESKPKAARKATAKSAAPKAAAALKAALDAAPVQYIPLSALVKSPFNARVIPYAQESVASLAETIVSVGLLQNLVVHLLLEARYGVVAGGRRLAALNYLAENGTYSAEQDVAVKVVPEELAVAASMIENDQRCDMHPAEQIAGFRTLEGEGKTPAQIGDLLGYSARHVQRMLKLAGLAPAVLEALATNELTTEHCHALALESDPERQLQVLDAARQKGYQGKPDVGVIRSLITATEVSTSCAKFQFVGAQAFSPDEIRVDLFSADEGGYIDALTLDTALLEKLQLVAEHLREVEGWGWCAGRLDTVRWHGEDAKTYIFPRDVTPVYTDAEQEHLDTLSGQYDEYDTVCEESQALEAEMAAIECAAELRAWNTEFRAAAGVVVSWNNGEVEVQRGVVLKAQATENSDRGEQKTLSVMTCTQELEPADEISLPLLTKMSSERTLAVQAALMQQTPKAVALLAWTLCGEVFTGCSTARNPLQIRMTCSHYSLCGNAPSGQEGAGFLALMKEGKRLEALLPEGWRRDFTTFFTLDGQTLLSLMGFCVACSVNGVQTREYGRTSRSPLDALETALDFHLRDWWQPTKDNFFGQLKHAQIIGALNDASETGAARDAEKMKKGDAAEFAESRMAANRWVPVWMRGPDAAKDAGEPDCSATDTDTVNPTAEAA